MVLGLAVMDAGAREEAKGQHSRVANRRHWECAGQAKHMERG